MEITQSVILKIAVHMASFAVAMMCLSGVDFTKIMRPGKEIHMQVLYVMLSILLGFGVAQFLLNISLI